MMASLVAQRIKNLSAMQETQVWPLDDLLEKGMATHSSMSMSGEFHGQKSLGGLQSMGPQKVGHNWTTNIFTSLLAISNTIKTSI